MKKLRNPKSVHQPLAAYSHALEISGQQRWLVLSGQIGMEPNGAMPEDPIEQFRIALNNIKHCLQAADMGIVDVVKLSMYLAGDVDPRQRREILAAWLEGHQPCMTLLYVAQLATPAIRVEIEALACVDEDHG